ncbi:MAG: hypothetical protein ACXWTT_09525 [Methylobacter sp.]
MEIEISKKQGERRFIKTLVYLTASDKEMQKVCARGIVLGDEASGSNAINFSFERASYKVVAYFMGLLF